MVHGPAADRASFLVRKGGTMGILAQTDSGGGGIFTGVWLFIWIAWIVLYIVGAWKMYKKGGQPGWACIIPFYNIYVLLKMVGRPGWWLVLFIIPIVSFVMWIIVVDRSGEELREGNRLRGRSDLPARRSSS